MISSCPAVRILLILVLLQNLVVPAAAVDIVVESRAQGQNFPHYREVSGIWVNSQFPRQTSKSSAPGLTPQDKCGSRKSVFQNEKDDSRASVTAAARFHPKLSQPERCHVYATWPPGGNAAPVRYVIKHADGLDTVTVAQDGQGARGGANNANVWVHLGQFNFSPGEDQYAELRMDTDTVKLAKTYTGQIYADAVRFSTDPVPDAVEPNEANPAVQKLVWYEQLEPARAVAARDKKRIFLYFYTPGTQLARHYDNVLLQNSGVKGELLRNYVPVKLNFAASRTLALSLGAVRGGTVLIYSSTGDALRKIEERLGPEEFLSALK